MTADKTLGARRHGRRRAAMLAHAREALEAAARERYLARPDVQAAIVRAHAALGPGWIVTSKDGSIVADEIMSLQTDPGLPVWRAAEALARTFDLQVDTSRHWWARAGWVSQCDPEDPWSPGRVQATGVVP